MPKILVQSKALSLIPKLQMGRKPGYELVVVPLDTPISSLPVASEEVHGVLVDADRITPDQLSMLKEAARDILFPVVIIVDSLNDREAAKWVSSGASDIFYPDMPAPLMGKRLGSLIQLYCMAQSIYGQAADKLTGLYNRGAFFHFAKEMINARPEDHYAVILSDIEYFKRINERFGEEQGDALLRFVGGVLRKMNSEDALFARYGGDQFVGILRQPALAGKVDLPFLEQDMQRLYREAPIEHFHVQFGIYEDVDINLPVSIMCDRALIALKTIKHQYGRDYARYTLQLQQRFNREQQILDSMEAAILEHQFEVYYQPKVDTRTSAVTGAEALVRWNHPVYGFMSPADFIPLFERSGFISKVDEYVWNQVCRDMKTLLDSGFPVVPVSINVSRKDLAIDQFAEKLKGLLEEFQLDPKLFHMELTESVYMEDAEILAPLLKDLKEFGIKIELDDFGSGYSSLGILSKLPVDIIKLDISLIRNLEKQPAIVDSIVQLMHTLGYETTAEGVDNEHQVELLQEIGCDHIQGYYYSKPLTLAGFCNYISSLNS